jgi:DNA-binding Xre family transcriptional regulator
MAVRRISGTALAEALGITRSTMYRRINGEADWPVDDLERVADFLGIDVMDLLGKRGAA